MRSRTCWGEVKLAPLRAERLRMENQISTWFIQEAWVGVKWKRTLVGVPGQPSVPLRLVGVEVVEHDMDVAARVIGHDLVHEVEELDPASTPIVPGPNLARGDVKGGEERGGAVPGVVVAVAGQRAAVLELEIALRPLERLDVGLLVNR